MPRHPRPGFPPPSLITTTEALRQLCDRLGAEAFVTVDTEFIRERTYWPELCVVQLAGAHEVAVVDAEAPDIDLAPLGDLLAKQAVMKVFHASRQDIEIFVLRFGDVPKPLFDTQIAAMVAGFCDQVGYDAIVSSLTGGSIDKAHRFTDWSARPLSPRRSPMPPPMSPICARFTGGCANDWKRTGGWSGWLRKWRNWPIPPPTAPIPDDVGAVGPRTTNRRFLGLLRAVAAWRELEAQRVNIPRQRLLRDEALLEIAATAPDTPERWRAAAESAAGSPRDDRRSLLAAIAAAKTLPDSALPEAPMGRDGARASPALVSLLKVLLAAKCEHHHVAAKLVASSDDIDRLATEDAPEIARITRLAA